MDLSDHFADISQLGMECGYVVRHRVASGLPQAVLLPLGKSQSLGHLLDIFMGGETLLRLPATQGGRIPADAFGQLLLGNSSVLVGRGVFSVGAQELPEAGGPRAFRVGCHKLPKWQESLFKSCSGGCVSCCRVMPF
jgi:hypothetical protein